MLVYYTQLVQQHHNGILFFFFYCFFFPYFVCSLPFLSPFFLFFFLNSLLLAIDPPEVMVFPPVGSVLKDRSSSFMCNVTNSSLEYTINWNFDHSLNSQLPEGVIVVNDTVLVILNAQPFHSGTYTCQVNDKVYLRSFSAVLVVNCELTLSLVCVHLSRFS